jgi:copper chaperone
MQYVINVDNVKCNHCVNTIQNSLQEIEGVRAVSVDLAAGAVHLDSDAPRELLVGILTALGYPEK